MDTTDNLFDVLDDGDIVVGPTAQDPLIVNQVATSW